MTLDHRLAAGTAAAALLLVTLALLDGARPVLQGRAPRQGAEAQDPLPGLMMTLGMEPAEGRPIAPDFALPRLDGTMLRLSDLRGRVVLINFWATWCPPCRAEMPAMERLYREFAPRGFTIVAVDYKEGPDLVRPFVSELALTFPIVLDTDGEVMEELYPTAGLPTTYLVDRAGRVAARKIGYVEWDAAAARALVDALLGEAAASGSASSGRSSPSTGR